MNEEKEDINIKNDNLSNKSISSFESETNSWDDEECECCGGECDEESEDADHQSCCGGCEGCSGCGK